MRARLIVAVMAAVTFARMSEQIPVYICSYDYSNTYKCEMIPHEKEPEREVREENFDEDEKKSSAESLD